MAGLTPEQASARIASLPLFHQVAGSRIVVVGEGAMGDAKKRLVERAGAIPVGEPEAHHASLAFVALEDAEEAAAVRQRLKAKGLLVNVADRPELCDFTTPSILDRDPLLIAVGTGWRRSCRSGWASWRVRWRQVAMPCAPSCPMATRAAAR